MIYPNEEEIKLALLVKDLLVFSERLTYMARETAHWHIASIARGYKPRLSNGEMFTKKLKFEEPQLWTRTMFYIDPECAAMKNQYRYRRR
jgi:hypothetical protein